MSSPSSLAPRRRGKPRKDGRANNDWSLIIVAAARFAADYQYPPSLRRIFYQLVSAGLLPNTDGDYSSLSFYSAEARRGEGRWPEILVAAGFASGLFPDLDDQTREIDPESEFDDALDWISGAENFRMDRDRHLPLTIFLGVEKRGILPYLRDWFGELGLPRFAMGGYHSEPFEKELKRRIRDEGRPSVLLLATDHDASGDDLRRNLVRWVPFDRVVHVALTFEQVHEEFDLPRMRGKVGDNRLEAFMERYGYDWDEHPDGVQVELDALDLDALRNLYASALARVLGMPDNPVPPIEDFLAFEPFARAVAEEEEQREILTALEERWDEVTALLARQPSRTVKRTLKPPRPAGG